MGLLEGLGVDVLGINCGLGPKEMAPAIEALWEDASTPLLLQPNAGLPHSVDGKAVYDVSPEEYAAEMLPLAPMATILGGCCGTTPGRCMRCLPCVLRCVRSCRQNACMRSRRICRFASAMCA